MCGIAGYFSNQGVFNSGMLQMMLQAIAHRGPDASGVFESDGVALGHRRLSIIDLSEQANQPMYSSNNRYVMVYNGEVYNYLELADAENLTLKTTSDSEVILELFSKYGISAVNKFNGMFAIAIYDKQLKELILFRDSVGVKPLYYFHSDSSFAFASELKSIMAIPGLKLEVNKQSVSSFLHLGYIPAPQSIYKNVFKLKPGYWIKVSEKGIDSGCFWKPDANIHNGKITDEKVAVKTLDNLLNNAVRMQMRSDVPFGVFLSGGTDSSLVSALAVNNSLSQVSTFSIGFKEKQHNEAEHALHIASRLKTNHHEYIATYDDALELITKVMMNFDEPFADSSAIPTFLVSQLASRHVKVVLSGDGGDELFLGYGAHHWAKKLQSPIYKYGKYFGSFVFSKMDSRYQRVAGLLKFDQNTFLPAHIFSQEQYLFSAAELDGILDSKFKDDLYENNFKELFNEFDLSSNLSAMELQALFDLKYYLPDDLLVKVDRTSMLNSIEARVPLLDQHIIEFALNLHPNLKIKNDVAKYLLKEVLYQYLPKKILDRPKQGFSIPLNNWLKRELNFLIQDNLSKQAIEKVGVLNFETVDGLLKKWRSGSDFLYNRVWQLIILQQWFIKNA